MKRRMFAGWIGLVMLAALPVRTQGGEILVSAAASLTNAFDEIGKAFSRTYPGTTVRFNYGASGALQQQIEQGAPVDVFASASPKEMDALQRSGHIEPATRVDFAANRLVLIVRSGSRIHRWEDLRSATVQRVAISDPGWVPSGRYARETLVQRGLWGMVQPKAVLGENVRQTLTYVADGDVEAGIVFATDARLESRRVRVVQEAIPGKDHEPIVYPAAVVAGAPDAADAKRFVTFLQSRVAQSILARYGFSAARRSPPRPPQRRVET